MATPPSSNGEFPTVLGPDASFKGDLQFEKGVRVLGAFEGTIQSKGKLHVAQGAKIKATIDAADVEVEGDINGNVTTSNKLQLKPSAKLHGDLRAARLEINEGAVFVGQCVVGPVNGDGKGTPSSQDANKPKPAQPQPQPEPAGVKK